MPKGIIQLCYRKIIDNTAATQLDRYIFEDSYREFLMQAQYYNQEKKFAGFGEIINANPAADKLHFLVSTAIVGYVRQFNSIIPDVKNTLGRLFLPFTHFRFELINSDLASRQSHQVAINFVSDPLTWHDTIDGSLLLSAIGKQPANEPVLTEMLRLQPFVSIFSLKNHVNDTFIASQDILVGPTGIN